MEVALIHMNGRMVVYPERSRGDAKLGRFLSPDNYIQEPFNTQSFNRYGYVWNNPLKFTDPSGEFLIPIIIGAIVGAYIGGAKANNNWNPFKWDWSSGKTWAGIAGGALVGVASLGIGSAVASAVTPLISSIGVTGGVLGYGLTGAASGLVSGAFSGGIMSLLPGGDGDFFGGALKGAFMGAVTGFAIGGTIGALKTPPGHSIWTGKDLRPNVSPLNALDSKGIAGIDDGIRIEPDNNIQQQINGAVPEAGPINYKAEYFTKVNGPDGAHNWNRTTIEIVADRGMITPIEFQGKPQILIEMTGNKFGQDGVFQLIIEKGAIQHQMFVPGGVISRTPIYNGYKFSGLNFGKNWFGNASSNPLIKN